MTLTAGRLAALVLAFAIASPPVVAQTYPQTQAQRAYSQAELDQMLAPIALYPDALLSQVLMAATYPDEVAAAARWSRANPGLQGDDAVRAVQNEYWDPSVKSLVAFPQVLQRMDEKPDWTRALGDAFLAQESQTMAQVQQLRQRARAAGQLASDERLNVVEQSNSIAIQPVDPRVVYVPYYDPRVVYGPWWWPAYQPVLWAPWTGYARPYRPGVSVGFWWGQPVFVSRSFATDRDRWQHDPIRRGGVNYRAAEVRQPAARIQAQPQAQPRADRRDIREPARIERRDIRQLPAQLRAQLRAQPVAPVQVQARPEQRARMPEAIAPQQPRAERHDPRREPRNERGDKGRDRS